MKKINGIENISASDLGTSNVEDYFKKWCEYVFANHKDKLNSPLIARVSPDANGVIIGHMYNTNTAGPYYGGFLYIHYSTGLYYFGYSGGTWYWSAK